MTAFTIFMDITFTGAAKRFYGKAFSLLKIKKESGI